MKNCATCNGTGEIEKMDYNLVCPDCIGTGEAKTPGRLNELYFAALVGTWCRVEILGDPEKKFIHAFPSNVDSVTLNILEGDYRPGLFTCWMAYVYQDRIKITPLERSKL